MSKDKISVAVIGHVDSGKSTLVGQLMFKLGKCTADDLRKLEKESKAKGKGTFKYAWISDKLKEERARGLTIKGSMKTMETDNAILSLIDCPGHRDFMRNMATNTAQCDVGLLVVDSSLGGFEAGFSEMGQTREHSLLAQTLGVKRLIVVLNKMDDNSVKYSENRFKEIREELITYLRKIGYNPARAVEFVPASAWEGENITERTEKKLKWYTGPTLFEAMNEWKLRGPNISNKAIKPLRIAVQAAYKIKDVGTVALGKVCTGIIKKGMAITIAPTGVQTEVLSLESQHEHMEEAGPGEHIGIHVKGLEKGDIKGGYVIGDTNNNPPKAAKNFTAQVIVLNHPGQIKSGYSPVCDVVCAHVACTFNIETKVDKRTGKTIDEKDPLFLKNGDAALVEMTPLKPLIVEKFSDFSRFGRMAIRDNGETVAVAVIRDVTKA